MRIQSVFQKYSDGNLTYQDRNELRMKLFYPIIAGTFSFTFLIV